MKFILLLASVLFILIFTHFIPATDSSLLDPSLKKEINNDVEQSKSITLLTTGDVLLARTINARAVSISNFTYPFEHVKSLLEEPDVTYINLETPLVKDCPIKVEGMIFCGDTRNVEALTWAGIDIINLANNHTANYQDKGIFDTKEVLENSNLLFSGLDTIAYKEVSGIKISFLGFNDVDQHGEIVAYADKTRIKNDIEKAKQSSDFIIVSFHWGHEYTSQPNRRQVDLAHFAIDSGADLIIGNHPHWIQPVEVYKNKYIAYSHGNFVFDQYWSQKTQEGIVIKWVLTKEGVKSYEVLPILIGRYGQPKLAEGVNKTRILEEFEKENNILLETIKHFSSE